MNAQVSAALLQAREVPAGMTTATGVEFEFSRQLGVRYDRASCTIWSHWAPSPRPCFNSALLADIRTYYEFLARSGARIACSGAQQPIEYVVLASAMPGIFNLGGDLELFKQLIDTQDEDSLLHYGRACVEVLYRNYVGHDLPVTTISLVQGECLGGGFEAALSSDLIIAERGARFGFPEILFNLFPGMGAYSFLQRKIGQLRAQELIASGKIYGADEMHALVVVDEIAPDGSGEAAVTRLISHRSRSRNGFAALGATKRRVQQIQFSELLDVVRIWVDATLRLTSRDLRLMQRLISRQDSLPHTQQRVHSVKDLRDALDEDRLVLFAQPVVRLADGMAVHYEILARIRDHDGSQVLPDNFIGLAESVGIIQEMDLRVVERLLGYLAGSAQASRRVFVNLSPVSIADQRWIGRFVSLMRASAVDPGQLVFEVTEAAAISDIDATLAFMRRLKDMGCRFALDRFGSGLSSFRYFRQLEADYVKIDGGFVRDLVTDEGNRIFVKAMNDVARGLKKQVIAEWVESPEVLKVLIDMGAEYGQGYLFQRPSPLLHQADELTGPAPLLRIA